MNAQIRFTLALSYFEAADSLSSALPSCDDVDHGGNAAMARTLRLRYEQLLEDGRRVASGLDSEGRALLEEATADSTYAPYEP